jgi:predicted component of type VI protein secretion system
MPKIIVSLPDGTSVTHELTEDTVTVGRTADNIIQIEDASVSSHHAEFTVAGDHHTLKDLGSTNGTRVNDQPFTEGTLKDGDSVRFGQIATRYATDHPGNVAPPPQQAAVALAVAESSSAPQDFANASPFKTKTKKKEPAALGIMVFAVVSILALVAAIAMTFQLQPPVLP